MKPCTSATSAAVGRQAGADRPDRLVGDHECWRRSRRRAASRRAGGPPRRASGRRRARPRSRRRRRSRSGPRARPPRPWPRTTRVGLAVVGAALGMADDDGVAPASASISAEMSPVWAPRGFGVAVLAADREPLTPPSASPTLASASPAGRSAGPTCRQRRRRAGHGLELGERGREAVHLPVSGDQRTNRHVGLDVFKSKGCLALAERSPMLNSRRQLRTLGSVAASPAAHQFTPRARRNVHRRQLRFSATVATGRPPLYDGLSSRKPSLVVPPGFRLSPATKWTYASRNSQGVIELDRQDHHDRGDGRADPVLRRLGYRRHLQGLWAIDGSQDRQHRNQH